MSNTLPIHALPTETALPLALNTLVYAAPSPATSLITEITELNRLDEQTLQILSNFYLDKTLTDALTRCLE